uniref:Uncharacterized protein n=1 Tax=Avena sativa TaxID=4498 RepID=A0ACD5VLC9_AVESA
MDHGGGGGRSSSRLRERLARMFRPGSLLRSTCNNSTASTSSSSCSAAASAAADAVTASKPAPSSACSSSRALLPADSAVARDRESFLTSSRRDFAALVGRTESFSSALDRVHRRAKSASAAAPARFSIHASPLAESKKTEKEKSPLYCHPRHRHRLGGRAKGDKCKKLLSNNPYGFSSSDDNDDANTDGDDVFSSDADERGRGGARKGDAEAFFSSSRSLSFSSDSSEFYTKKKKPSKKRSPAAAAVAPKPPPPPPPSRTRRQQRKHRAASSCDTCGVKEGFRPVVSAAEEQVRRGFAVVQRSRDPYADFRASMVEMVVSRQLFGAAELERLLRSYLSLNAPRHHPVILQAFSDIWVVLHGG